MCRLEALRPSIRWTTARGASRDRAIEVTERSITEVTLRQATHLASVGHSVAELRHIMGRYTDVGTQDVLVLRG